MKVIFIDTKNELILGSIPIEKRSDAQRALYIWKKEERDRQCDVDRVLVYGGMSRLMDPDEPFPVPPQHAGQCLDARLVRLAEGDQS